MGGACGTNWGEEEWILDICRKETSKTKTWVGWVDNIKMDLREIGWGCMDCIDRAQGRNQWRALVNTVINLQVP
jgi:hypothetical protein